jgi:hypothetical protein
VSLSPFCVCLSICLSLCLLSLSLCVSLLIWTASPPPGVSGAPHASMKSECAHPCALSLSPSLSFYTSLFLSLSRVSSPFLSHSHLSCSAQPTVERRTRAQLTSDPRLPQRYHGCQVTAHTFSLSLSIPLSVSLFLSRFLFLSPSLSFFLSPLSLFLPFSRFTPAPCAFSFSSLFRSNLSRMLATAPRRPSPRHTTHSSATPTSMI